MSRQPRIDFPGATHHVVNRGVDHHTIFYSDTDRAEFGRLIVEIHERFGVIVLAYCLMDNHYHLVIRDEDGHLSAAMQHLQSVFAMHVNERHARDGHLFKGRFFSTVVSDDAYLLTVIPYVERNALDLPGIIRPSDYRWSSHRRHLGLRQAAPWLDTSFVLGCFGGLDAYRRAVDRNHSDQSEPARLEVGHLDNFARLAVALHAPDHVNPAQLNRTIATALIPELNGPNRALLSDALGFTSRRAALQATSRAQRRLSADPTLTAARDELRRLLFESSAHSMRLAS
ncbi:MAG: transposase [Ilumatobacter sp.]